MGLKAFTEIHFSDLPGWGGDNYECLRDPLLNSLKKISHIQSVPIGPYRCNFSPLLEALERNELTPNFLETHCQAVRLDYGEAGLFTGYFEPILNVCSKLTGRFKFPIHEKPKNLLYVSNLGRFNKHLVGERFAGYLEDGILQPYATRAEIYQGAIDSHAPVLAWAQDLVDFYFLQVQGSGVLSYPKGTLQRIGYSATNGRGYKSLGKYLLNQGLIDSTQQNMDGIKQTLKRLPESALKEVLGVNPSYIFFEKREGQSPVGTHKVELIPGRSLAVDPKFVPLGVPLWLDSSGPQGKVIQKMMIAHDTGAAIKGPDRGDYFWGTGPEKGNLAGQMKSNGQLFMILPKSV